MRIRELIQTKPTSFVSENVHDPKVDWAKFKLAMAALATDETRPGYGKIDGIIFLGLAGDPNSRSVLDVKLKAPARIGVADPDSGRELGFGDRETDNSWIAGEFYPGAYKGQRDPSNRGYEIRQEYEYNIIVNHRYFDQATGQIDSELLAHEAQHRGFYILSQIPEIRNAINPRTRKYIDDLHTRGEEIPGLGLENTGERNFLEHLLMYSFEAPNQIGDGSDETHQFRSKAEIKMFQMMYQDINSAAVAYVKRYPVPKGGFELLRKEVDKLTPDTVEIKVKPDAEGRPVVIGRLTDEEIERRNKLIKGGADIDKSGKVIPKAGNLSPAEIERRNKAIQGGANIDKSGSSVSGQSLQTTPGTYIVKSGDSLSRIANRMGIRLPDIIKANPQIKNPNLIYPGDQVNIPEKL
jgi:LysM repeat protein